jgi:hypothetical protein
MRPVNIEFHLYAGDPDKGHDGWMCSITFSLDGKDVRIPGAGAHVVAEGALLDALHRYEIAIGSKKGSPLGNLPAVATCQTKGWGPGTWLRSDNWTQPRWIEAIDENFVTLRTKTSGSNRVRSFPSDVSSFTVGDDK